MITPGLNNPGLGMPREDAVQEILDELRGASAARMLLVLDRYGAIVLSSGGQAGLDTDGFASLSAAHFDGNRQLATVVGESEFIGLSHLGNRTSVHFAGVADAAILAVFYDGARSSELLHTEGRDMVAGLESPIRSILAPTRIEGGSTLFGSDWAVEAETEIDRIFRETC